MKKSCLLLILVGTMFAMPVVSHAHGDDHGDVSSSLSFEGSLASPLLHIYLSAGGGAAGGHALLEALRRCGCPGVAVPEPATMLLTGLFMTMGYTCRRKQQGLSAA